MKQISKVILSLLMMVGLFNQGVWAQEVVNLKDLSPEATFISKTVPWPKSVIFNQDTMTLEFTDNDSEEEATSRKIVKLSDQKTSQIKMKSAYCARIKKVSVLYKLELEEDKDSPIKEAYLFISRDGKPSIAIQVTASSDIYTEYILEDD